MSEGDNQNRMRRGIVFSAILHVLLLIVVVVGLPRWHKPVEIAPAIPVEVVTLTEKPAAPKAEPKPQPVKVEPPKPEIPPPAPPPPQAAQPEPEPVPAPEPKEVAALPPQPEPEPIPVPEPAPKPKPEPEVKKPEPPKPEPEVKKPEPPKPVAKPKPPKPVQEAKKPEEPKQPSFLKNIEKWKATTETASTEPPKQQPAPQPTAQPSSVQDQLARNELSELIRRKVESCWNVPVGARDAGDLLVEIRVVLNRDGSVISADIVDSARASADTFYRAAAESARRAVRTCSPFNELPADRYDIWQTLTLRFNPKEMLGT
jgi:outer membrane biosynthesis protein TonB